MSTTRDSGTSYMVHPQPPGEIERTAQMSMREEPPMFPTHLSGGEPSALGAKALGDTAAEAQAGEEPLGGSETTAGVGERSEITVVMVSAVPP